MSKYKKVEGILFDIFTFLFIISIFNREFIPFGIDLRYIEVFLGLVLIMFSLYESFKRKNIKSTLFKYKKYIT